MTVEPSGADSRSASACARSGPSRPGGSRARGASTRPATRACGPGTTSPARATTTVPVVENWTILSMAAALTERVTVGPFVLNVMNRHPAVVARMASTLQIASGGRLVLGIGIGGAPREHAAYGIDFPAAPERVARLEEAVAVIRALWTGGPVTRDSPFYPLRDASAYPIPDPLPRDHRGRRDDRRRPAGRPDRRWMVGLRRQLRGEPARLPRIARGQRAPARGPASASSGSRAFWLSDEPLGRLPVAQRAARDLGALARGRRGWGDRAGADDGRRRRPGRGRRALVVRPRRPVLAVRGTITDVTSPSTTKPALTHPCARCGAPVAARRRAVRALQPARAARRIELAGAWHRDRRGHPVRRLPGHRRTVRAGRHRAVRGQRHGRRARRQRAGDHAERHQSRHERRPDHVSGDRSGRPNGQPGRLPAEPVGRWRQDRRVHRTDHGARARPFGRWRSSAARRDGIRTDDDSDRRSTTRRRRGATSSPSRSTSPTGPGRS